MGLIAGLATAGFAWACSEPADSAGSAPAPQAPAPQAAAPTETTPDGSNTAGGADLVARGRQAYMSNCIACHNVDPTKEGGLGPPVAGSSYELLEARVIRGEYPPGYQPVRDTRVMIALPHLEGQIDALTAFLNP